MKQPKDIARALAREVVADAACAHLEGWPEETAVTMTVREYSVHMGILWEDMVPACEPVRAFRGGHQVTVVFALSQEQQYALVGQALLDSDGAEEKLYATFLDAAQHTLRELP